MHELKKAIIDADIKNHGDKIRPPQKPKKEKPPVEDDKPMYPAMESDPDPYGLLADQEMPQAIPGLMGVPDKGSRKSKAAKKKGKNQDDNVVDDSGD